jgi:predicted esterase
MIKIKLTLMFVVFSVLSIVFNGCGIDNTDENIVGNNLVSATVIDDINASVMLNIVKAKIDANATNAFGYKAVKITYKTKGQNNEDITASGLLVIPSATEAYNAYRISQGETPFSISAICDNHGTIFTNAEAPTNTEVANGIPDYSLAVSTTGYAGFALIAPDYIGYGDSNNIVHPYMLKKASARASLDMIRASIRYMTDNNILFNGQLYISGYSQGGYTAMALAQDIEENHSDEFKLMGVAPMAGPYDLKGLGDIEVNATHLMQYPAFLEYIVSSYSQYNTNITLDDILNSDINKTTFNPLFMGDYNGTVIQVSTFGLSAQGGYKEYNASKLFSASFINDYQNNQNNAVKVAFEENSVYNWKPKSKIYLIQCEQDEIIPLSMTETAYNKFIENGATDINKTIIPTVMLSQQQDATHPFIHANCATEAYGAAINWFNQIRSGEIK